MHCLQNRYKECMKTNTNCHSVTESKKQKCQYTRIYEYGSAPVSMGKTFQDLPQLCETVDNTERYIYNMIFV
jgi:hypothetical protein